MRLYEGQVIRNYADLAHYFGIYTDNYLKHKDKLEKELREIEKKKRICV